MEHFALLPYRGGSIVAAATCAGVVLAVLLHCKASLLLSRLLARTSVLPRPRTPSPVSGLLAAHVTGLVLFAFGVRLLLGVPGVGELSAQSGASGLADVVYVPATTYDTLGCGDVVPVGNLRFLFAMEALTGLVLITWSAKLGFLGVPRHWRDDHAPDTASKREGERG